MVELGEALTAVGVQPLSEVPLEKLGLVHWDLTILTGLLEAELSARDGLTDMAEGS